MSADVRATWRPSTRTASRAIHRAPHPRACRARSASSPCSLSAACPGPARRPRLREGLARRQGRPGHPQRPRQGGRDGNAAAYISFGAFADSEGGGLVTRSSPCAPRPTGCTSLVGPPQDPVARPRRLPLPGLLRRPRPRSSATRPATRASTAPRPAPRTSTARDPDGTMTPLTPGQPPRPPGGSRRPDLGGGLRRPLGRHLQLQHRPRPCPSPSGPAAIDGRRQRVREHRQQTCAGLRAAQRRRLAHGRRDRQSASPRLQRRLRQRLADLLDSTPARSAEVYVRDRRHHHPHVSRRSATTPDPNGVQPKTYQYATPDGHFVYFSSGEKLTNNSQAEPGAPDLYRYDFATGDAGRPDHRRSRRRRRPGRDRGQRQRQPRLLRGERRSSRPAPPTARRTSTSATARRPPSSRRSTRSSDRELVDAGQLEDRPRQPERRGAAVQLARPAARLRQRRRSSSSTSTTSRATRSSASRATRAARRRPPTRCSASRRSAVSPSAGSTSTSAATSPRTARRRSSPARSGCSHADTNGKYDAYMWKDGRPASWSRPGRARASRPSSTPAPTATTPSS